MPRAASTFATDLSKALMPMINKPTGGYLVSAGSCIEAELGSRISGKRLAAFVALTNHLTLDYAPVLRVLKACEGQLLRLLSSSADVFQAKSEQCGMSSICTERHH